MEILITVVWLVICCAGMKYFAAKAVRTESTTKWICSLLLFGATIEAAAIPMQIVFENELLQFGATVAVVLIGVIVFFRSGNEGSY